MDNEVVVIIGAGPAGMATAIQLKRYNIESVLLEQENIGGLLRNANLVENYPGFPEGISGLELVELFKEQLKQAGVRVCFEKVIALEYCDRGFVTETDRRKIESSVVVVATGTEPKKFSTPRIPDTVKERVFYEIHSIRRIKNNRIAIIGAGDVAFDYALSLSRHNEVTILNRSAETKCLPVLWERCLINKKISYLTHTDVQELEDARGGVLLHCIDANSQEPILIEADYVIVAIGREPYLDFMKIGQEEIKNLMKARKLYLIGDVRNEIYRQTAIAAGDGIRAAVEIYRNIERKDT